MPRDSGFFTRETRPPKLPAHWPPRLQYITSSRYHSSVPPEVMAHIKLPLSQKGGGSNNHSPSNRPKIVIRVIASASHPAHGQFGLFAAQKIPPKTHILDYLGEIHCDERPDSDYDLSLCRFPDGISVGIDASIMGNEARFINDYRGVSDKPNSVFVDGRTASADLKIAIWSSTEEIKKGQEILVSYGKSWWRSRTENHENEGFAEVAQLKGP